MTHEEICTYEVAKLAKEKGFNEKCNFYYQKGVISTDGCFNRYNKGVEYICSAPTQSLLQRWLREEKALHIQITLWEKGWYNDIWVFEYYEEEKEYSTRQIHQSTDFDTYELALEDAIKYALENLI